MVLARKPLKTVYQTTIMIDFACKEFEVLEVLKCSLGLTRSELDILVHLLKAKERCTAHEIASRLKVDLSTAQRGLKNLVDQDVVRRFQQNRPEGGYQYVHELIEKKKLQDRIVDILHKWLSRAEEEIRSL